MNNFLIGMALLNSLLAIHSFMQSAVEEDGRSFALGVLGSVVAALSLGVGLP